MTRFLGARKDGLRPKTALRLYFSLVRPILEYAAPVLVFGKSHMDKLEALQLGIVKRMLGLRDNTKNESVRVISGVEPIAVRLGFLKLKHQYRILKKPGNSLVKKVYLEVKKQPRREGFHRECEELRDRFGVPLPDDTETPLCAYGRGLKAAMYRQAFQEDLAAVRASGQASVLASLFPPESSYFSYRPLDLMVRVLDGQERAVRTAFLQNLAGTSFLANRYRKSCAFCDSADGKLEHLVFECPELAGARAVLLEYVGGHIEKSNQKLSDVWKSALTSGNRRTTSAILFGGNYVVGEDGERKLFRKTHYKHFHHSDRTCVLMGTWLKSVGEQLSGA